MKLYRRNIDQDRDCHCRPGFTFNPKINGYVPTNIRATVVAYLLVGMDEYAQFVADPKSIIPEEYHGNMYFYAQDSYWSFQPGMVMVIAINRKDAIEIIDLPYGLYEFAHDNHEGVFLRPMKLQIDNYINLYNGESKFIYDKVIQFRDKRSLYEIEGRHKDGVLLYGPPGNGKTTEICHVLTRSKEEKLITLYMPSHFDLNILSSSIRESLEPYNKVLIMEEIVSRVTSDTKLSMLLNFLDGEQSWNHCMVIATTNNPELLPFNVIDRPGRFDDLIEFKNPSTDIRRKFLIAKGVSAEDIELAVKLSEGLSLDYLAQSIRRSKIRGGTVSGYLREMKESREKVINTFKGPVGFGSPDSDDEPTPPSALERNYYSK